MVFEHVIGSFEAKEHHMKKYAALVKGLKEFITWSEKIDRKDNRRANKLSKAIAGEPNPRDVVRTVTEEKH